MLQEIDLHECWSRSNLQLSKSPAGNRYVLSAVVVCLPHHIVCHPVQQGRACNMRYANDKPIVMRRYSTTVHMEVLGSLAQGSVQKHVQGSIMSKLTWIVGHGSKCPHQVGHGLWSEVWKHLLSSVCSCLQMQKHWDLIHVVWNDPIMLVPDSLGAYKMVGMRRPQISTSCFAVIVSYLVGLPVYVHGKSRCVYVLMTAQLQAFLGTVFWRPGCNR